MNSPVISIIIAVYNAESYLSKGIENILAQTFSNFEILLVDDGSTDTTVEICDRYANKDTRIRVFHEQHQGVAHARQKGIENVQGEYTIHIDADDKITPTMLEEMYDAARETNADMLICDYVEIRNSGTVYHSQKPTSLSAEGVANDMIQGKLYGALWNKLIRTTCFRGNNVSFHKDLTMREDMFFVFDTLPYCSKIAYLPKAFYNYDKTRNASSLTNTYLSEDKNYYTQEIKWHDAALNSSLVNKSNKVHVINSLLNIAYITLSGNMFTKTEWKNIFSQFREAFMSATMSYKKRLVMMALNDRYMTASIIRSFISKLRRKA